MLIRNLRLWLPKGKPLIIQNDFTGLKLSDGDHVELKKAAMEDGTVFDYNHAGTYKCVYLVTPASGEAYLVARNITVTPREAETDGSNGGQEQESGDDEPEADPVLPTISPEDAPETLEEPEETEEPEEEEAEGFSDEETEDGSHQVDIVQGNEFNIELDHEDGRYQTGEMVNFSGDIPQGSLIAVGTSLVEANQTENTEDLLYAEVSYDEGTNSFSFEMPEDDVALSVLYDQAEGGISTVAASDGDLWDDSTDIEANTYYYYSDGKLHPFDSVMGQGGNDSYKYIRYKAGGKTYTVYAYCMQHSKQSPPSGTTYKNMVELDEGGDDRYLRKAMFYGYGGPGWGGTFNGYNINPSWKNTAVPPRPVQCSIIWSIIYMTGNPDLAAPFRQLPKHVKRDQGSPFKDAGSNDHGTDTRAQCFCNGNRARHLHGRQMQLL